jgi:hypothetical protein
LSHPTSPITQFSWHLKLTITDPWIWFQVWGWEGWSLGCWFCSLSLVFSIKEKIKLNS